MIVVRGSWVAGRGSQVAGRGAAIASVFIHLSFTDTLDPEQKRSWLRRLTGRHALAAWSDYLSDTRD